MQKTPEEAGALPYARPWDHPEHQWQDRVSNLQVLDMAKSTSIEAMILKNRLRWVGHVIRMEDNRLPKQLMSGHLASRKQKQGRPLRRFKDCVKASISHAEITIPKRSLSPVVMTGLDGKTSPDMPQTHLRRGAHTDRGGP